MFQLVLWQAPNFTMSKIRHNTGFILLDPFLLNRQNYAYTKKISNSVDDNNNDINSGYKKTILDDTE